ncbi:MAG: sugar ABC transporter permease [Phycisphaerales bacterium]|nr:sugar ABC transporter permease [Phycisphaerales bacterium]
MTARARVGLAPYLFLLPFLVVFGVFVLAPLGESVVLSTRQMFGPGASVFVGLDNFRFLLHDPLFYKAVRNTLVFTAGSVFIQLPLALGLAMLLNRPGLRGRYVLRLVFFSPQLVGLVFLAVMTSVIFQKRTGVLNQALHALVGVSLDYPWLERQIMPTLILAALWMYVGFNMIYFLAALQNVDRELTEAASIDGAGPGRRFLAVTLPAIAPVGGFVVLLSILGSLQLFELPYILLTGSGPDNKGLTIVTYLYQSGFETGDLGYASAIGWVLAILLAALAVGQRLLAREARA